MDKLPESLKRLCHSITFEEAQELLDYLDSETAWRTYDDCAQLLAVRWPELFPSYAETD